MFSIRAILTLVATLLISGSIYAQDVHYTQYNLAPLSLNPSLIGNFEGTFRVGGLYRDQGRNLIENQYVTPSVYIDAPVFRGFGKNDWVGIGAVLVNDKAGTVALTNTIIMGGISYHMALGSKGNTVLSIGGEGGIIQKRVDKTDARFEDEILAGGGTSADLNNVTDDNITYGDFNLGLNLRASLNKAMNFNLGFALHHIAQPNYSTFTPATQNTSEDTQLPRRIVGHGEFNVDMSPKWTLSPTFLYQRITSADELVVQAMAGHHFNAEKDVTFRFGAGYRLRDAAQALVGFDYKGLRIGAAYDFTVSEKSTANANRGGFEIAASYIAKIRKTPVVKPVIFCPRF